MVDKMLDGQIAIVTGSSKGIGKEIALTLAKEGANVIINGNNRSALETVKAQIQETGRKCEIVVGDISLPQTGEKLAECAVKSFGRVDILVNNAGINDRTKTLDLSVEKWKSVLDINLDGVFYTCKAVLPIMRQQNGGRIVNITSANGKTPHPNAAPSYGASKAGVTYLTKHFALEFAPFNIRVNAVQCGPIESDMTKQWTEEYRIASLSKIPLNRLGTGRDVAMSVLFLVSDMSEWITGACLNLSGGKLMD